MSKNNKPASLAPEAFPWYTNHVQDSLQKLADRESRIPQQVVETISKLRDSHLFWQLFSSYEDAMQACNGDTDKRNIVQWAFFARLYIAGSYHPHTIETD